MSPTTILAIVCLLAGAAMGWGSRALVADAEVARLTAEHATAMAAQAQDAKTRETKARAEERRMTLRVWENADAAALQAADARRSAAAVADERDRLRNAYVELASRPSAGPEASPAASGGSSAAGAGLVFARLFDRGAELLQSCAAALDQSRIAGLACERSYDSLTLISTED